MPISAQLRRVVARYGAVIAVVLALSGVAALAGAGVTYANPPTTTETYVTDEQTFSSGVETSARVTNNTTLYADNETLENMPVYFFSASPNLTYHIRASVPPDTEATVTKRLTLRLEATRNGEQFWEQRRVLAFEESTVTGGDWTNATVNMSAIQSLVSEKRSAVGAVGTLSVTHRLNVTYATDRYEGTLTDTTPLVTTGRAFWVDGSLSASRSHTETATRTTTGSPDVMLVTLLALVGLSLLGAAASVAVRARDYDLEAIEEEIARAQYDEWISSGEIPTKSEKEYIRVDSIEDVVDVAIDSNKRVIYDDDLDVYAVVEGDLVYFYTTDAEGVSDWLDV